MLPFLILVLVGLEVESSDPLSVRTVEQLFENFVLEYHRSYADHHERSVRFRIFKYNLEEVIRRNMERKEGEAVFGITKFMDLTKNEFRSKYTGLIPGPSRHTLCSLRKDGDIKPVDVPEAFDWRELHAVTGVKNQGVCFGCWAFSATGNIEGMHAIKHKELIEFSEQQLLDCDPVAHGCNGGVMAAGFKELIKEGGSETEEVYPFIVENGDCKFNSSLIRTKVVDCFSYNLTSQENLKQILYQYGPVSAGVKSEALLDYESGIISAKQCDTGYVDHGVLLVGYGTEKDKPYWIVKNSWAADWGEKGFYRMERKEGLNTCGVLNDFMAMAVVA